MPVNMGGTPVPSTIRPMDSGVCSITPSDLVGNVGNLINRVKDMEQEIAELKAKLTKVGQISSLGGQIGWVGGITYMGTEGWTQTEYGTLIPPPGVTLASLGIVPATGTGTGAAPANALQLILKDENGNIVFAFNPIDGLYGTSVTAWNAAALGGAQDYARVSNGSGLYSTAGVNISRGISVSGTYGGYSFTLSTDGIYLINSDVTVGSSTEAYLLVNRTTSPAQALAARAFGSSSDDLHCGVGGVMECHAGDVIASTVFYASDIRKHNFSAVRISA